MTVKMEEVDGIIIHTLRGIGCDIEEDVRSLIQFNTELIVEATARCLKVINNELDVHYKLPPSMSARFRVGTSLASAVQGLGYRGEVGYQTFLYSNESDIRRVFMFLLEKLPKDTSEASEEPMGASALLQRSISAEVAKRIRCPWTPAFLKPKGVCWRGQPAAWQRESYRNVHNFHASPLKAPQGLHDITKKVPKELRSYYCKSLPYVSCQPRRHHSLAASVLEANSVSHTAQTEWEAEWNQQGLLSRLTPQEYKSRKRQRVHKRIVDQLKQNQRETENQSAANQDFTQLVTAMSDRAAGSLKTKGSRFTHAEKLQFAQDEEKTASQMGVGDGPRVDTEEELKEKREKEVEQLKGDLGELVSQMETLQMDMRKFKASSQQMEERLTGLEESNKEKEEAYKVKKMTIDLLPDADNNIAKLQALIDSSAQRLVNLASQWEKHRAPLIDQYRELKEVSEGRESETQKKLDEIRELRETMKDVASDTRKKEELYKQLVKEYERMTKDVNRSAYTRKILEIVANIKKQKTEIDKVLVDTKSLQKEINQLTGKLDRTFTVTDELIFRDARKDEAVRKAYKYLAALHENCNLLIQTVEETGVIVREIRDLEDQIEQESHKKAVSSLAKITEDYQEMKKENATLLAKYKKQQSQS